MAKTKKEKEPKYIPSPINNEMLNYRVYYMSASEKIMYSALVLILGGLAGLVFYGGLFKVDGEATIATYISNLVVFLLVGGIAMRYFLPAITNSLQERRAKKLERQFMDLLEGLSASLSAGNTVNNAFVNARNDLLNQYNENDMIVQEMTEIVTGMENGRTLEEMLIAFGERSANEDIENFGNVIGNCFRLGGNFQDVVRRCRDIISGKIEVAEEINTKLASNKLQHNAMCIMPIVLVGMLKMSNPSFANNLSSLVGVVVTTVAIGVFVGSYFWGRKIIDIR